MCATDLDFEPFPRETARSSLRQIVTCASPRAQVTRIASASPFQPPKLALRREKPFSRSSVSNQARKRMRSAFGGTFRCDGVRPASACVTAAAFVANDLNVQLQKPPSVLLAKLPCGEHASSPSSDA